ncbi:MAG: ATP synthase F1 subunit delta [Sulfobacillus thermosulfidooxidans]|uniref:ATP synthase subunit delta n=1 Tax=Sulfobacillus thermosulfidooxidans TaxID=28034 RepID=A0A2T2WQR6_SULTH|nr:MAG: ATP synthase F1 subunit delta [Sulfobacillus thermosulfidooxidans]
MTDQRAVKPYAKALFELAKDNQLVDKIQTDLEFVIQTIEGSKDLQGFLYHPQVSHEAKRETLKRIFGDSVHPLVLQFLQLVMDKGREHLLAGICDEFNKLVEIDHGIVEAHVESAVPLTAEQQAQFAERLGHTMGKKIKIIAHVNPALIGGAVIRVGDRVLDGSVLRRMEILGERLRGNGGGVVLEH